MDDPGGGGLVGWAVTSLEEQAMGFWRFGGSCMRCHDEDGPWGQVKAGPSMGQWWCEPCLEVSEQRT